MLDAMANPDTSPLAGATAAEWNAACIREWADFLAAGIRCPRYRAADSEGWADEDPAAWALIEAEDGPQEAGRIRELVELGRTA